jgi:hypothetical protein
MDERCIVLLEMALVESIKRLEIGSLLSPRVQISPTTPISKVVGVLKDLNVYEAFLEDKGK